jgi:hypothetical protein
MAVFSLWCLAARSGGKGGFSHQGRFLGPAHGVFMRGAPGLLQAQDMGWQNKEHLPIGKCKLSHCKASGRLA